MHTFLGECVYQENASDSRDIILTIILWARVGYEMIDSNHLISNKYEWNNCFIKNAPKI